MFWSRSMALMQQRWFLKEEDEAEERLRGREVRKGEWRRETGRGGATIISHGWINRLRVAPSSSSMVR